MDDRTVRDLLIAQLTDTHVLAADPASIDTEVYVDNNARLAAAVASILDEPVPVAAVVATGDLTNDGRPEEYDALLELVEPLADRLIVLPGNHDVPEVVKQRFPTTPWADADHASWVTVVGGVRIVGLDTTHRIDGVGQHGGAVDDDRLGWLDQALGAPHDGPTVLAMHHPPFDSGVWWMDRYGFVGVDGLLDVVAAHPVDRIMCGHLHRPMTAVVAGVVAQVGMSTVQHVGLDLVPERDVTVVDDPAGYQLLQVRRAAGPAGATSLVMHHRYVDPVATPVTPVWSDEFR